MKNKLVLIPTPIDETLPLETVAREYLLEHCMNDDFVVLVEEHKVARQRWIKWALPREAIDRFVVFNEHTQAESQAEVLKLLQSGKTLAIMSDGGLPAFCDPGQKLVKACHEQGIKVSSTPFPNSIALALAMSGIDHSRFTFAGFLSTEQTERKKQLDELAARNETIVMMDTPYRLKALLSDVGLSRLKGRKFYIAANLNSADEKTAYGSFADLQKFAEAMNKPEFILVISGT